MGATARCRGSLEPSPRAPSDGREPLACAPSRRAQPRETYDGTIVTDKVNEMWGTDMSQTVTIEEGRAYVFVAVEHANSEIIGIHAACSANRFEALEPVRAGCIGASAPSRPAWRVGSSCVTIMAPITCPAISRARSNVWASKLRRPSARSSQGNGVAERFIRTLKENLLWVRTFKTIELGNCAPSSSHSPGATMKLGSSRGMDTKRSI